MKRFCAILLSALLLAANAFGQVAVRPELNLDAVRQAAASSRSLFLDSTGRVSAIETFLTLVRIKGPSGHEEAVRQEVKRLMTAGKATEKGLFWIDSDAIKTAHDFFLKYGVISKPVDLAAAYDASFIESVPVADRKP